MVRPLRSPLRTALLAAAVLAPLTAFAAPTALAGTQASATRASGTQVSPSARQAAFAAAAQRYGVPASVLLGVSYLESRWDDHAGQPSAAGGYGPMHLTDVDAPANVDRADGVHRVRPSAPALHTVDLASRLTGIDARTLETDPAANVRGGAAVLASYQRDLGLPTASSTEPGQWYGAVARYSGATVRSTATSFANEVFARIRAGAARTTTDGQRVRLSAEPDVHPATGQASRLGLPQPTSGDRVQCPEDLGCIWIPAPYEKYGSSPGAYGNHDIANRPHDLKIDYIIIHDTEASWDTTLQLVQDPTYLGWNYSIRSSDGQVAQHLRAKDVGWQAGNWYVNMHSIGIEHEGFAAQGASWFTEAMYENSATLVRYLAHRYDIPLNRSHIIGHDQVPGITPAYVAGMHWDPGPYWDWEHYFDLLRSPIGRGYTNPAGAVVTIKPGFDDNQQPVTGCGDDPSAPCDPQGTNFVYLHTAPSEDAPLVSDIGLHPDGSPSTTYVSDIGARAAAGEQFAYAGRQGDWTAVWYLGQKAWFHDPAGDRNAVRSVGMVVTPKAGREGIPVYGRAYPEPSAYPPNIPVQTVVPLQYTIQAGQSYVLEDAHIQTDYYRAVTFDTPPPADHIDVVGQDKYYEVSVGHREMFVRAADVDVHPGVVQP